MKDGYNIIFCYNLYWTRMIVFTLNFQNEELLGFKMTLRKVKVRMVYKQGNFLSKYNIISCKRKNNLLFFKSKNSSGGKKEYLYVQWEDEGWTSHENSAILPMTLVPTVLHMIWQIVFIQGTSFYFNNIKMKHFKQPLCTVWACDNKENRKAMWWGISCFLTN